MARMARRIEMDAAEEAVQQASFDFLPEEMRLRRRFGSEDGAEWAERRAKLKVIDRQIISTGSRLAAARLREILRPIEPAAEQPAAESIENGSEIDRLAAQRTELRALGTTLFYFRDQPAMVCEQDAEGGQQRIHPRPLPTRYFC